MTLRIGRTPAVALTLVVCACSRSGSHPLERLALSADRAPAPCKLEAAGPPKLMLPKDPTWKRDLAMTVGWWTGRELPDSRLDAALSHLLAVAGSGEPGVVLVAMRFKKEADAQQMEEFLSASRGRPNPPSVERRARTVLLVAPGPGVPAECARALVEQARAALAEVRQ